MYKLMVIDDETKIREGIIKRIKRLEFPVEEFIEASNGREALDIIKTNRPHVIFVDINMPFVNGLEFIQEIRKVDEDLIIIIISGYDNFKYAQKAIRLGVFEYILKPVNRELLKETLEKALCKLKRESKVEEVDKELSVVAKEIKKYINENYHEKELSLGSVAIQIGFSESYLSKIIKKELGYSFSEYLTKVRIDKAKELMNEKGRLLKIYEIADLVGYSNQHYFSRVYKKVTGESPIDSIL